MKVAVNKCFGGFGLSAKAKARLAELNETKAFFYRQTKYTVKDGLEGYTRVPADSTEAKGVFINAITVDLGEKTSSMPDDEALWLSDYRLERTDPKLIQVIEELGDEASGPCAKVRVVEIPDGIQFEIDEYDGMEHVAEVHRCW